jgi:hypothetical protein
VTSGVVVSAGESPVESNACKMQKSASARKVDPEPLRKQTVLSKATRIIFAAELTN